MVTWRVIRAFTLILAVGCAGPRLRTSAASGYVGARTISFNVSQEPHSLDPLLARSDDERQITHLAFDMLLDADEHGRPVPALAIAVPTRSNGGVSRDGLTITYHLRRGVRWQDGAPFSSRDVYATWRAVVDPHNAVASTRGYDLIERIDTPDPSTAIIHLHRAWAPDVNTLFTYGTAPMPVLPAHLIAAGAAQRQAFAEHPVGTGPFRFVGWQRGQQIVFEANSHYYRGPPRVQRIVIQIVPDANTTFAMLRSGQLDWSLLSPTQRMSLSRSDRIGLRYVRFGGFGALAFNCRAGFFSDVRARKAAAMAIDRQALSRGITRGQYPVTDSDQPPFSWAYDPLVRLPGYDPSGADRMLDSLGWKLSSGMRARDGKQLHLTFAVFPESDTAMRTAVYVQEMLRRHGIAVDIERVDLARFYLPAEEGGVLMSGRFDLAYFAWRSGEDPDDSDLVTCKGVANYAGYCDPRIDALETRALGELSQPTRARLYREVQRTLARALPYDFLYAPRYSYGAGPTMRGLAPTPFSATWNAWQWSKNP